MSSSAPALRAGARLASAVCSTRMIVVRAPADARPEIGCGGAPVVDESAATSDTANGGSNAGSNAAENATLMGKRYVNADGTLELLCTAPGAGELSCDGVAMTVKEAKPLPASD